MKYVCLNCDKEFDEPIENKQIERMNNMSQSLIDKILKASEAIHKKTLNSSANYIVCSPEFAKAIENLDIKKQRRRKLEAIRLKNKIEEMNVITLCGSTKYKNEYLLVNKWLTLQGNILVHLQNKKLNMPILRVKKLDFFLKKKKI